MSVFWRRHQLLVAGLIVLSTSGCVRRRLTVRTSPPGAVVSVDNQVIGTSPAASSFVYYGTREVRIEKDGYRTETLRRRLNPPWYQTPPLDFITETLWPWEIRDERVIDVELVPKQIPPMEEVVGRADALRGQARAGVVPGDVQQPLETITLPPGSAPLQPQPMSLPNGGLPAVISSP
ncbi:PEGA domain-containing protein [Roseimaritima ulvae]|uniref:PEGA domain protein n=1 Tax=Roseimaritima ulvae TaxID=980254 RepID=A0A5B9QUV5_9BACT|nr:PEGA domain-containing protein [Roseimaritima ulvae]QEG42814.1 PEGA domain protein [Roseimaritima ulvae]